MGCGASSTSGTTSADSSTQLHRMHSEEEEALDEEDAMQQQHRQSIEASPIDRRNALRNFNHLESSIQTMEETKCFEKYRVLTDDADQLKKQLQVFTEEANQTNNQIFSLVESGKLTGDDSLQSLIIDRWMQHAKINAKDVSAIELLSNQKMLDIKAGLVQKDIERLENDAREAKKACDQLQDLYQQRDNILNQLFDGSYGNEKEMLLEREVDGLMEERHYIEIAKMRWISSSRLISEAIKCLESGCDKLRQYEGANDNNLEERYSCILEARTSFTTYLYKVSAVQGTLLNVKLPHIKEEDLEALEKCTRALFLDTFAANRLKQTLELVTSLRAKTVTQQSWVKTVLNSTIKTDLMEIREKVQSKGHELRFERALLIKQRLEQELQQEKSGEQSAKTSSDSPFDLRVDSGVDSELGVDESALSSEEQMARILASGKYSELSQNGTPLLPGEELGPIPSDAEIFGKIVQLRSRHNREMAEFEQNQRLTRVRITQGLKDKLNDRRSRRSRMEMHRRHLEALQESPA